MVDALQLKATLLDIRGKLPKGAYSNEASVSQGIVLKLLRELGWPDGDTEVVTPQYPLPSLRVDYALCHPPRKPLAFVEVKQTGKADGAERQLFAYAFHKGVPLAVLTDGQEWRFFLPAEQGDYDERRLYTLDLLERDVEECAARLERYLGYDRVRSGEAIDDARVDYRAQTRERDAAAAIPQAWTVLVDEQDSLLLEIVAETAGRTSGITPSLDAVADYLRSLQPRSVLAPQTAQVATRPATTLPSSEPIGRVRLILNGTEVPVKSARDALLHAIGHLADRDPEFLARFAALPKHGRSRRYLAADRGVLYPGRPDLAAEHVAEVRPGWWVGTNNSRKATVNIIELATQVAGLARGSIRLDV